MGWTAHLLGPLSILLVQLTTCAYPERLRLPPSTGSYLVLRSRLQCRDDSPAQFGIGSELLAKGHVATVSELPWAGRTNPLLVLESNDRMILALWSS
jgi:hypothetical protein